ncbi:hypothetical protein GE21DRAFT_8383 [Neurospora crassa]|uniref:Uncharacterized protein n=1 Tax=Neurospora crassa (strain ATCC 24698 / 74-OR23-1A / CBS 708.71 / DSM 1257 / FGSC 987) TaxID=367110 RepID=Q7S7E9_NEUCR|nr:hypothetical protein NCU08965 [Neurospora crassa OR74A]EAA31551.1 hypothetical protein NCU08965 [Neurospora crassa OR74A]KHE82060.1 hypothetical protein GE21DRAFT_8383 [Neurospora crassa]|eukprot:XP_960787.1 hypothetical protein NCU08965 [Neurospora crassa OR74A]
MAFHQPARQLQQQRNRLLSSDGSSAVFSPQPPGLGESQTWVLFTPGTDAGTTASYLSDSLHDDHQQVTPGRSQVSDLGSFDTAARSDLNSQNHNSALPSDFLEESVAEEEDEEEEDPEFDSLDSHLADFRTPLGQSPQNSYAMPVFPSHDGMGSFQFKPPGMSSDIQDRLYQFELLNPNRIQRRNDALGQIHMQYGGQEVEDNERNRRIEAWRLEQSKLLLERIRKETRRRQSQNSLRTVSSTTSVGDKAASVLGQLEQDDTASLASDDWHDHDDEYKAQSASTETLKKEATNEEPSEGIIGRTREAICNLIGVDDRLLAILLGEALPDEEELSTTPTASTTINVDSQVKTSEDSTWQLRMLNRIAKELGMLIHQLSTSPHPGAFSTYTRVQQMPLPYAGLPVIPETSAVTNNDSSSKDSLRTGSNVVLNMSQFQPTITQPVTTPTDSEQGQASAAIPAPSELTSSKLSTSTGPAPSDVTSTTGGALPTTASSLPQQQQQQQQQFTFTQDEWEQELDIGLIFRYLRSRFSPSSRSPSPTSFSGPTLTPPSSSIFATASTADLAAKAARVRQHHPLMSHHRRPHHAPATRSFKVSTPSGPSNIASPTNAAAAAAAAVVSVMRQRAGSCASQSTQRSATRTTGRGSVKRRNSGASTATGRVSHGSRHYWDLPKGPGSVKGGSVVAGAGGGMGSWGEV